MGKIKSVGVQSMIKLKDQHTLENGAEQAKFEGLFCIYISKAIDK